MSPDYESHPVTLADHLAAETEGERTPAQVDPLEHAEQLLSQRRIDRVMRMTALGFAQLTDPEKRNYRRWARHLATVLGEKADMFERNSPPELELPTFLRASR